jgi:hypothetical protein
MPEHVVQIVTTVLRTFKTHVQYDNTKMTCRSVPLATTEISFSITMMILVSHSAFLTWRYVALSFVTVEVCVIAIQASMTLVSW